MGIAGPAIQTGRGSSYVGSAAADVINAHLVGLTGQDALALEQKDPARYAA